MNRCLFGCRGKKKARQPSCRQLPLTRIDCRAQRRRKKRRRAVGPGDCSSR